MSVATTPIAYPLVNGSGYSYSSIELNLGGLIFRGFKAIDFSRKRDRPKIYGNSPDPLFKVVGKNEYEASGELYLAEFDNFVTQLGDGYGDVVAEGDSTTTYVFLGAAGGLPSTPSFTLLGGYSVALSRP